MKRRTFLGTFVMWPFSSTTDAAPSPAPACFKPLETMSLPESSLFYLRDGDLMIRMNGKLFPKEGGAECGMTTAEFNLSDHIRTLLAQAIASSK